MDDRVIVRCQDKEKRINNFDEVSLGFDSKEALKEANRCLNCIKPRCMSACPVNINIPAFISEIKKGNIEEAYKIITDSNLLPAICGRVCPQEKQCEGACIKGFKDEAIAIGALERYVADQAMLNDIKIKNKIVKNGKRIAIVGSGPSGLSAASNLAKMGYDVTVFEALHKAGGVLTYGIPEFRLPKNIVKREIESIKDLGVKFELNALIGKSITMEELEDTYDAIFVGTGAGLPKFMGIKNESANGVFSANEILTRINLMGAYKDDYSTFIKDGSEAIVVGGGNVAMDAARSLVRMGYKVHIAYRRSMNELPARVEEVRHAVEEGIEFNILSNPKEVLIDENNCVKGLVLDRMELVESEDGTRANVKVIENSEYVINADMVVMAIGTTVNPILISNSDIKVDDYNRIVVEGTKTSNEKVFAGGDIVTGAATVILACEAGKKAALEIDHYLQNKDN